MIPSSEGWGKGLPGALLRSQQGWGVLVGLRGIRGTGGVCGCWQWCPTL